MLRCRDACVRCAGSGKSGMEMGLSLLNGRGGIASRTISRGGGSRLYGQSSGIRPAAAPATFGLRGGNNFSTTTARRISVEEIETLRTEISVKEKEVAEKGAAEDERTTLRHKPTPAISHRALDEEMRWLKDPAVLADRVKSILVKHGEVPKALALVHRAQNDGMNCIVAWNHVMDYEMEQGRSDSSFKIYNDMKKRGRRPDAHTYTIMFRGFATNAASKKSVPRAMSVFESLFSRSSDVKPSTIHANAALNVCARHGDMEALWTIASKLPEEGYGAPDARTFTIILNALRATTSKEIESLDRQRQRDGIKAAKAAAVREAKRMWVDIIKQWRAGSFMVDEHLVHAMGRMLVFGGRNQDYKAVFSLLQQTMDIEIQTGKKAQYQQEFIAESQRDTWNNEAFEDIVREPGTSDMEALEAEMEPELVEEEEFQGLFEPVRLSEIRNNAGLKDNRVDLKYPAPTNKELTLVVETCRLLPNASPVGRSYWDLLTSETGNFRVEPDLNSYYEYLRLLRTARASATSLSVLKLMAPKFKMLANKSYLLAMSTCQRDKNNPNVLRIANGILSLMKETRAETDPATLLRYIALNRSLAIEDEGSLLLSNLRYEEFRGLSGVEKKKEILTGALSYLQPHIKVLKTALEKGDIGFYKKKNARRVYGNKINGEPARFRAVYRGNYTMEVNGAISVLSSTRDLLNRILSPSFRELLSESQLQSYRDESAFLSDFLEVQKNRHIWNQTIFAIDEKKAKPFNHQGQRSQARQEWRGKNPKSKFADKVARRRA